MPISFLGSRIRLRCDGERFTNALDAATGGTPEQWRGTTLRVDIGSFYLSSVVDVSLFTSITLEIKPSDDRTGSALMSKTTGSLNNSLTLATWEDGTSQHATLDFSAAETQLDLGGANSKEFWMVVSAVGAGGEKATLGACTFTMLEDGHDAAFPDAPIVGANLVPALAAYDVSGNYTLTGLQAAWAYSFVKGANDTSYSNGGSPVTDDGEFVTVATSVVLHGAAFALVTTVLREVSYLSQAELQAMFLNGSLRWRGPWDIGTTYYAGDVTTYDGKVWRAIDTSVGVTPVEGVDWTLLLEASGDVLGPDSAVNNRIAVFDGITGKLLKDGGATVAGLQPIDATLTALAAVTTAADKLIYATGVDAFATTTLTAFARTILDDADEAAMRTTLGLVIGTNVQAYSSALGTFASNGSAHYLARANHTGTQAWGTLTGTPTTVAGYGITDFNSLGDARYLQLAGGTMAADAQIIFQNSSRLTVGTTDLGIGASKGISLRCSIDYELNWQAGWLTAYGQDGVTEQDIWMRSSLAFSGQAARSLAMNRHTTENTAGNALTVQAGGATAGATNKAGGWLTLSGGISTGTGVSGITLYAAPGSGSGTSDNTPIEAMEVTALRTWMRRLDIRSTGASYDLQIGSSEALTANRSLSVFLGDAARSLTLSGDSTISGTNTGDQTTISGNAATATALQTARAINGVNFDGTAPITVTAAAGTLTGNTLAANVVSSSLTSVGTIAAGVWNGNAISDTYIASASTWNALTSFPGFGTSGSTACVGNDSRLSDFRTPVGSALASASIWVGSAGNVATAVEVTGDVTITNAGVTAIGTNKVTLGMQAQMATASLLGRNTAGTGNVEVLSASTARTLLGLATGDSPTLTGLTLSGKTAGSVLFAGTSGLVNQDNANLFWDDTNNRLGIGTASPSMKLHIAGLGSGGAQDIRIGTLASYPSTSGAGLELESNNGATSFAVYTDNSTSFRVAQVSETDSAALVYSGGVARWSAGLIYATNGGALTRPSFALDLTSAAETGIYLPASNTIGFVTARLERARINSAGLFGIGITPTAQLHIVNSTAGNIATVIKLAASQTASALEVQNSSTVALLGIAASGALTLAPAARTSGVASYLSVTTPADTTLTASTESIGVSFLTGTRQWATGALTTQREHVIAAPTYAFVGASTVTNAATLAITAAPIAGTNATITNAYALWVQAGITQLDGHVSLGSTLKLKGYTVAGLPAGAQGYMAYATDLLTPTFLTAAVGGGAVVGPVFHNGTTWVSI